MAGALDYFSSTRKEFFFIPGTFLGPRASLLFYWVRIICNVLLDTVWVEGEIGDGETKIIKT